MFTDETQKQNGAASQNDAPGDASLAGAAPQSSEAPRGNVVEVKADPAAHAVDQPAPDAQAWLDAIAAKTGIFISPRPDSVENAVENFVEAIRRKEAASSTELAGELAEKVAVDQHVAAAKEAILAAIEGVEMSLKTLFENLSAKLSTIAGGGSPAPSPTPIVQAPAAAAATSAAIAVGSKVKVWADAAKKTWLAGTVVEVHDGGHSFDVNLPSGVAHVQADGLELDELD